MMGKPVQQQQQQEESSGSVSSDWDDWNDPEYIEEQREALAEFQKKQKELRVAHGAKKKKKKSKKKKNKSGVTSGDALGLDGDDQENYTGFQTIKESEIDEEEHFEEEKMPGDMSRTRVIDQTDNMGSLD